MTDQPTPERLVQDLYMSIGLVPVNGEHPDDFELSPADFERLKFCNCAHCGPDDGICPMTVQAMIRDYLTDRDNDLATVLAPRLNPPSPKGSSLEWGHRYPDGSVIPDSSEAVARSRAAISQTPGHHVLTLLQRSVTPWTEVFDV